MTSIRESARVSEFLVAAIAGLMLSFSIPLGARAQAPTVPDYNTLIQNDSANDGNFATGLVLSTSALVTSGTSGIYGYATQGTTQESVFTRPDFIHPNQLSFSVPYSSALAGGWTLNISTSPNFTQANTTTVTTSSVAGIGAMPFVGSIGINASNPLSPTISWTAPTAADISQAQGLQGDTNPTPTISQTVVTVADDSNPINVTNINPHAGVKAAVPFGQSFSQANIIYSTPIMSGATTSATIPLTNNNPNNANYGTGSTPVLQYGQQYSIAINLENTIPGTTDNPACELCNVDTRSRSYFDYTPINPTSIGLPSTAVINLPSDIPVPTTSGLTANSLYQFSNVSIQSSGMTYIDPAAAYGFIYTTGANDPNFASVDPVTVVGNGIYQLWAWENGQFVEVDSALAAGSTFNFLTSGFLDGISEFEILGIDPSAELDPTNITAFVTGLTFTGGGTFNGTMQSLSEDVSTPLPSTLPLMLTGIIAFGLLICRRRGGCPTAAAG